MLDSPVSSVNAPITINASPNPLVVADSLDAMDEPLLTSKLKISNERSYFEFFFATLACFACYASLFFFQDKVSKKCDIDHGNASLGFAISLLSLGNLVFRLGHNLFFAFLKPRGRLFLAMTVMAIVEGLLFSIFYFADKMYVWQVGVIYGLGGVGIGTFEANILNTTSAYGKKAKSMSVLAIPFGIASITVISKPIMKWFGWIWPTYMYAYVGSLQVIGVLLLVLRVPAKSLARQGTSSRHFFLYISEWRQWFPVVFPWAMTFGFNMMSVSMFSPGIELYVFNDTDFPTVPVNVFNLVTFTIPNHYYFSLFSFLFMIGDSSSRKIFQKSKFKHPYSFLIFTIPGIIFGLSKVPGLVLATAFLVSFGNGGIYVSSSKAIDSKLDSKYNGIAYSVWLFLADGFSFSAFILTQYVRDWLVPPVENFFGLFI
ncbi:hypothetical protein P9112_003187 [Eukaryota sp. TZLM1-RC]